jgi:septum formation protein
VLTQEEINYYIDHYQPYDKAGAYGIQEWIGNIGVEKIEGSYANIVGLPVAQVLATLEKICIK